MVDSEITAVTDSSDTYTVNSGGTAFKAGHLAKAEGFTNAANNRMFKVASSTGTTVVAAGTPALIDEIAPPSTAKLQVIGFERTSGDITATSTGLGATADYIWGGHVRLGLQAGTREAALHAVDTHGPLDGLTADEGLIIRFGRELLESPQVSDDTFNAVRARYGEQGLVELTAVMSLYTMYATILRVMDHQAAAEARHLTPRSGPKTPHGSRTRRRRSSPRLARGAVGGIAPLPKGEAPREAPANRPGSRGWPRRLSARSLAQALSLLWPGCSVTRMAGDLIQQGHTMLTLVTGDRRCASGHGQTPPTQRGDHRQPIGQDRGKRGIRGFDTHKQIKGRKRHLFVDTLVLILTMVVTAANGQDRDGAKSLLEVLRHQFSRLRLTWADGAYAGDLLA